MRKSILIIFISSLIGFFIAANTFSSESYSGKIYPDGLGGGRITIEKDKEPLDFLKRLLEMDDLISKKKNEAEQLRIEREKLEIEREKLRILQQQMAIQNRRQSEQESKIYSDKEETNNEPRYPYLEKYKRQMENYYNDTSPIMESSEPIQVYSNIEVYFNNGKTVICDKAWQDGDTVYIVHQGKKFAIGYDKSEIDMSKSFR